jgi:isopentenyl-diphosphate delta-isomerase
LDPLTHIGHGATEMLDFANQAIDSLGSETLCKNIIISGGIQTYLDGYYLLKKAKTNAIYAQASAFLKHATGNYSALQAYCELQRKGLETCYQYLQLKD